MSLFEREIVVSFGDCDPAGIVYYPNFFRWMDGTFHAYLKARSEGHKAICEEIGARGLGLMDAKMTFRSPAADGDVVRYAMTEIAWSGKSFDIVYEVTSAGRLVLEGFERRGVFVDRNGRLAAGSTAPLRSLLEGPG